MARFRYRMQNILDISEKLESQAKIAYSLALQALLEEQEKLQQLIIRRAQYEMELKRLTSDDLDLREIQMTKNAINSMKSMIRVQMMNVQRAEHLLEQRRKELEAQRIQRKTHETLKEKAFVEFKKEEIRKEDLQVDELVAFTHRTEQ